LVSWRLGAKANVAKMSKLFHERPELGYNQGMSEKIEKIIHFGEFVRWNRINAGKTTEALGRELGLTARRVIAIEQMPKPDIQHTTTVAIARAFGIDPEAFDQVWKNTPVPVTRRKLGPTTDEARKFTQACAKVGIAPIEGMRRLRSWIVEQDEETRTRALSYVPPHRIGLVEADSMFTDAVDHLQYPAESVRRRLGQQAANSAKSQGSDATSGNKHR
jgi:transcriptional regulator with XRE-family HTH domain